METDARDLQRALAKCKAGGEYRYPHKLRKRVGSWVAERRRRGDLWVDIVRVLGVPAQTLSRWASTEQPVEMRPVEMIGAGSASTGITIVTAMGVRIEGLTITEAAAILRSLT